MSLWDKFLNNIKIEKRIETGQKNQENPFA